MASEIVLERHVPKQLEHLIGINDVRIAAELSGRLEYFFAAWELPQIGWRHRIIPDAVFRIAGRTFALEYDRGLENLRYFVGSKIAAYRRGLAGLPLAGVLVVVDSEARRRTLARAIGPDVRIGVMRLATTRAGCSFDLFLREDGFISTTSEGSIR